MAKEPLQQIIDSQREFTSNFVDLESLKNDHAALQHWLLEYIGHAQEELVELRREAPARKQWKKQKEPLDFDKIRDEYSDLFHFVMNIGLVIGLRTSEDFLEVYNKKHKVVLDRHANGY